MVGRWSIGTILLGTGGRYPKALWGLTVLSCRRQRSIRIWASRNGVKTSPLSSSSWKRALKLSQSPFSHGEPGGMNAVFAPTAPIQARTFLAINSAPLSDLMYSGGPREA
jgi:hypothetical protein